jgi:hypothetical protein
MRCTLARVYEPHPDGITTEEATAFRFADVYTDHQEE